MKLKLTNIKFKSLLFVTLSLIFTNTLAFAQFSGGSGIDGDPYKITSKQDLEALADSVAGTDYWSERKYFILMNDITDSVETIIGMGRVQYVNQFSNPRSFQGDFNGNNKKIALKINYRNSKDSIAGLFGTVSYAKIYDLTIDGSVEGTRWAGGICAFSSASDILNCTNRCSVTYDKNSIGSHGYYFGGIVGLIISSNITNCMNYGYIEAKEYTGGISGFAYQLSNFTNCVNYGKVYLPSIPGQNINTDVSAGGGICGMIFTDSTIKFTNCVNYGDITADYYTGGICAHYLINDNQDTLFNNCHNYGNIKGIHAIGGITGCFANQIFGDQLFLTASITNCTNSGNISGTLAAGGITGHSHSNTSVLNCVNIGTISGQTAIGGITSGYDNNYEYIDANLENCINAGLVIGTDIVGGIAGRGFNNISNCLNTGVVIGTTKTGGIVGETNSTTKISNCHYDKQMCIYGGIAGEDIPGEAEGYLTKEIIGKGLQTKLDNSVWDFNNDNIYPTLQYFAEYSVALVATSPVYLYDIDTDFDRHNSVRRNFKINLENNVSWDRIIGNVNIVNDNGIIVNTGNDTLTCSIGNHKKLVPLNVTKPELGDIQFTVWAIDHKLVSPAAINYRIPIYIKASSDIPATSFTISELTVKIDKNIFYPRRADKGATAEFETGKIILRNVAVPALQSDKEVILCNIIGNMLLGSMDSCEIILEELQFAEILSTEPTIENGSITLNICREGGNRYVEVHDKAPAILVNGNPVNEILEVSCNIIESGEYTLELIDMTGKARYFSFSSSLLETPELQFPTSIEVSTLYRGGDDYKIEYRANIRDIEAGSYVLVLKNRNILVASTMIIITK